VCPLTLDHANLLSILDGLQVAQARSEAATAIGEGLGLAVERLRQHPAKSKVIILLSDGVSNAGELEPLQAAELAVENDIKVYTIGAGTTGYAPMPIYDNTGQVRQLGRAPVEIDEKTLQEIAQRTGGRYFHARDAEGLVDVYREIDRLERSEITEIRYLQYREHYPLLVLMALTLLALAALSSGTWLRRLP
jgi:Ca-activated chloride channel family protein